jgi:DNA modification methylase
MAIKQTKLSNVGFDLSVKHFPRGLHGKFLWPPFSVLHASDLKWQSRKREWISLGIKSDDGRDPDLLKGMKSAWGRMNKLSVLKSQYDKQYGEQRNIDLDADQIERFKDQVTRIKSGTSIFDPVLCELMYAWFCPEGGQVIDPFAGGSVRGIVASVMGLKYWGVDLRKEQIDANEKQRKEILPDDTNIAWVCGDSKRKLGIAPEADFVFSCPPYGNLETYSDLPTDLSNMDHNDFLHSYNIIIDRSCDLLKDERFACFVVGNYRDKKTGAYKDLVGLTIRAFENNGLSFYNDIILVTSSGTLSIRAGIIFKGGRKVGKNHQNILVFYKGNPREAKTAIEKWGS